MRTLAIIIVNLLAGGLVYICGLLLGMQEGMRVERERIRNRIITDQAAQLAFPLRAAPGPDEYAEAEEYADKMVRP